MLRSFNNLARFDALCAYLHPAVAAAWQLDSDGLKIGVKAPTGFVVSV